MTRIPLYRWIPNVGENLGDWLNVPILRAFGCEPIAPTPGGTCLMAIGSILHPSHYEWSKASHIVVWGTGIGNGTRPSVALDFRAVRGPMTARTFHLPDDFPMGDPSMLLPELVKLPPTKYRDEVLYVNHISTIPVNIPDGCVGVSARVGKEDGLDLVARITSAKFVASESLHGCMIAAAYGVPWGPCSVRREGQWCKIGSESKWNDWCEYIGVPHLSAFPKTLEAAKRWWEKIGRNARVRSTGPLLDTFNWIKETR